VTQGEASRLLGVSAVKEVTQSAGKGAPSCLIQSSDGVDSLRVSLETIAVEDAPRLLQHIDEERGDERPSMHGDSWFEISIADSKHPDYRRMVVHRDRFSVVLDLHSSHQKNPKAALEKVWFKLSERLPNEQND
jgi:hypothetical protein